MKKESSASNGKDSDASFIDFETDRYGSLKLIDWFDLNRVQNAHVLVIGAGAIGNEVLKNLALLGVGNIYIYDRDTIEMSNLTRSILFRAEDCNRLKSEAAADAIRKINPDINVVWRNGDIRFDLGLGVIRRMDAVIGCLDNRGARVKINEDCFRVGRPWVDAGIGQLNGQIRVFSTETGACYECSFTEDDYEQVGMPCNRLASIYAAEGKIPTTPTIASIVAGVQVQETLKLLDYKNWEGRTLVSHELIFNGTVGDCMRVELMRRDTCDKHETIEPHEIIELVEATAKNTTFGELLEIIEKYLGGGATLKLNFDVAFSADCVKCNKSTIILKPVGLYFQEHLKCEKCGNERNLKKFNYITKQKMKVREQTKNLSLPDNMAKDDFIAPEKVFAQIEKLKLADLNIPPLQILVGWSKTGDGMAFELTGDKNLYF